MKRSDTPRSIRHLSRAFGMFRAPADGSCMFSAVIFLQIVRVMITAMGFGVSKTRGGVPVNWAAMQ